ncbi:helix-turn-helix domain-containing protein [Bdellovibrio sp. HCB337]|uniref:helix-turn-helix domain-containing protein n=1 Tax=Bdellovibrio sp. HCB337 TaxID=3394358 RepID=UPI0039A77C3F
MKRTGELLKKAREKKGLSINEIALSLKISSKVLKAIEEGDTNQLPAKTFLRGFVQSYANYLRLDVNDILQVFQEEMGTTKPAPLIQMPEQDETLESFEKKSTENPPQRTTATSGGEKTFNTLATKNNNARNVTFTFLGVMMVGLIIFTKKMIDKYQKEGAVSEVEVTDPLMASPEVTPAVTVTPTSETAASPVGMTSSTSPSPMSTAMSTPLITPTPMITPTPTPAPKHSPSPTATPAVTPTPTATPKATATPTPTPSPSPSSTPTPSPSASPSPSPSPANKPVEVIIEALDNVEIDYTTKDGKSDKISLNAEQVHTFKSKTGLRLNISNGGAVNVIVNGKDLGIPGNLGKPVKLNF